MTQIVIPDIYDDKLSVIIKPIDSKGGLFLGNEQGARDLQLIKRTKTTGIITISKQIEIQYKDIPHYHIKIQDSPFENIETYFDKTFEFIERNINRGNVFVHCQAGISRSSTIVIAYLMKKHNYSLKKAYEKVKNKRQMIKPNQGFMIQLENYQEKLHQSKKNFEKIQGQTKKIEKSSSNRFH